MTIKEESIRQLQNYVNIVDIISDYVQLKKKGRNYLGLCPFHKEKTPSFNVNEEKGLFYCFGCGEGGNVLTFLMKMEKYSFIEAVEALAKKSNFKLEYNIEGKVSKEEKSELEILYEYSQSVSKYFQSNLFNSLEGEKALKYLLNRGLTEEIIRKFEIGFAPSSRGYLINFCERNKLDRAVFESLGLFIKAEDGNLYERFRDRIIFPIVSTAGRVIAFGGRILSQETDQAKYINSPETKIYIKGRTLYGLNLATDFIRKSDSVVLVEGYMDTISLYQKGIKNVVASSGTSLTLEQLSILSRYTKNIYVMYDSDAAGKKAALRASELIIEADLDFKVVLLPDGEDPDSFARKNNFDAIDNELKKSLEFVDFAYQYLYNDFPAKDNQLRINALKKTIEIISKSKDPIKRAIYAKNIADRFNILESAVLQTLDKYLIQNKKFYSREESREEKPTEKIENKNKVQLPLAEKRVIKLLLDGNLDIIDFIFIHLNSDEFESIEIQKIFKVIYDKYTEGIEIKPDEIINSLEDDKLKNLVSEIVFEKYRVSKQWSTTSNIVESPETIWKLTEDYIKKIKIKSYEKEIEKTKLEIKKSGNVDTIKKLLEYEKLIRKNIETIKVKSLREF